MLAVITLTILFTIVITTQGKKSPARYHKHKTSAFERRTCKCLDGNSFKKKLKTLLLSKTFHSVAEFMNDSTSFCFFAVFSLCFVSYM